MHTPRLLLVLLWLLPLAGLAQPSLTVSVDRTEIQLGERITVDAQLDGGAGARLQAPRIDGFVTTSQISQSQYFNGRRVQKLQLGLQAIKVGKLVIPPFRHALGDGTVVNSEPIEITVSGEAPPTPAAKANPGAAPEAAQPEHDELGFLRWEVDRTDLWLGDQVRAKLVLYVNRELRIREFNASDVNPQGFWTVDRAQRSRGKLVQFGQRVYAAERLYDQQLFPLRAGTLTLPAVDTTMVVQTGGFGRRRSKRIQRRAEPVTLTVKRLPTQGRPPKFGGPTVGRTRLEAGTNRTKVKAEDGLQFTLTTRTDGLIQNVPEVELPEIEGLRVFPPSSTTNTAVRGDKVTGLRRQVWLLKPTRTGRVRIPALTLPWFDPRTGTYKVARSRPVTVNVIGTPKAAPDSQAAPAGDEGEAPKLRSVRAEVSLDAARGAVHGSPLFYGVIALPPLAFLGLLVAGRLRRRRDASAGDRAARRAARDAKSALSALTGKPASEAYGAIASALHTYLAARLGRAFKGLTHGQLTAALTGHGVSAETAAALVEELENCDFARFAPGSSTGDVASAVGRAAGLVDAIEREVA